jgi:DNA-binding NarL/FixJ family response regulator
MKKKGKINEAPKSKQINILIADDHPVVRTGLKALFSDDDIKVVAEAADGAEALEKIIAYKPDVAVLDLMMPKMTALDVLSKMDRSRGATKIIVLTGMNDERFLDEAIRGGANGYVCKDYNLGGIGLAIRSVMKGHTYVSPEISGKLLKRNIENESSDISALAFLSRSEIRVLGLIAENKTNREVADTLKVSPKTVKNHRARICKKLGLAGANALLHFAIQHRTSLR